MYSVKYTEGAVKGMQKLDRHTAMLIYSWIEKNLVRGTDPRLHGEALGGDKKGYRRYRVGSYRLIAEIDDGQVIIYLINVAHRRDVYDR
ncbi:type II toxin-antitoxin system RelE family toxin [Parasphaerochaeta coccoides]|uniref:Addiction module toxin, RelE/StbE family n=1 Tax=Parasphaerochaeta coccoides (strain ATCC BAA-1237 / DSM 17374 / SPN1) TaxID=760011 RepID=F4GKM1_PARC1|nr:type II toxin-antitoxin system RelE/ParE family toxin [Parasphaerochaeta coccoides]AEC01430.1 addiction module toxin, RelE/StbE family [Parasphaerochaeta coccoides DSM 17374]